MSSYEIPVSHLNPFSQVVSYDYDTLVKPPPKEKLDQADAVDEIRRLLGCRNKSGMYSCTLIFDENLFRLLGK